MSARWQSGISLIEMMVGITVGLIVVAGASMVAVNQISEHKRVVLETQTQQELRAASEIMVRELRKAGSWASPELGVWSARTPVPQANPFQAVTISAEGSQIEFSYSNRIAVAHDYGADAAALPDEEEERGFRLSGQQLEFRIGDGGYQPLTDPASLVITRFQNTLRATTSPMASRCAKPCDAGSLTCPPTVTVREVRVLIEGYARHDATIRRSVDFTTRLAADQIQGTCPA